jgi:hypothetical protein
LDISQSVIKKCYKNPISPESKVSSTQSEQIQATETLVGSSTC